MKPSEANSVGANLKVCPQCHARALAPFLGPKRRCKACGTYVDVLDLLAAEFPPAPVAVGEGAR